MIIDCQYQFLHSYYVEPHISMSLIRPKSLHYGTQRRVLCAVLATLISLCAMMIALPGLYQILLNQSQAASNCHSHLSETAVIQDASDASVMLTAVADNSASKGTGSNHSGSSTVCSGDFMNAEGVSTPIPLLIVLGVVLCLLPFLGLSIPTSALRFNNFLGLGPPFSGHLRSHLGLRRIHI